MGPNPCPPGAYKYLSEVWRKKQSDTMRFLLRVRCWEYRQQRSIVRCTRPTRPDKARMLGYKAKQGVLVYRIRLRRGGRKRSVLTCSPTRLFFFTTQPIQISHFHPTS